MVEGPLPGARIARRIGLGRRQPSDELSVDGDTWRALAGFDAGAFGALRGVTAYDDRTGERHADAATAAATEQRGAHDRRIAESPADFDGADLSLADLRATRLVDASLRRAKLEHADLTNADLRYADLTEASLGGAELRRARLDHARWNDGRVCASGSVGVCR